MLAPFVFMSVSSEGDGVTGVDDTKSDVPPNKVVDSEVLVYTIVFGSLGGILPMFFKQLTTSFEWSSLVVQLLLILFGIRLGLKIGFRLFRGRDIKFSFHSLVYGLLVLLLTCSPYWAYIVIKNVWVK